MSMKNSSLDLTDLFGAALIVYMLYYFVTQMAPLIAQTIYGRQFLRSFVSVFVLFVIFTVLYYTYIYVSDN